VIVGHSLQASNEEGITADVLPVEVAEKHMEWLAAKNVVDLGGKGKILVAYLTGFPLPLNYTNAYVSAVEELCPECEVEKMNIQPTSIGKDAPQQICNKLRANPAESLVLSYDAIGVGISAACKSAGVELPKIYTYSPDAPGVEELANGEKTAGAPQDYGDEGMAIVDAAIRVGNEESIEESGNAVLEMPIWSAEFNNLPKDPSELTFLVPNGQQQWEELWGVK
jgi:ABC-type sugar transport system substrate-binding protein